jgi:hypothetical protein
MSKLGRVLAIALAIAVLTSLIAALHLYLVRRLILDTAVPEPLRGVLVALVVGCAAAMVLEPIAQRLLPRSAARLVAWPAFLWMGFAFFLVVGTAATEIADLVASRVASAGSTAEPERSATPARHRALLVAALAGLAGGAGLVSALRPPACRRVEIHLARWPDALDGFRIVQLSDLHIGSLLGRSFAASLVERVNTLEPDLIAVTGDLVDGGVRHLMDEVEPFAGLRARHGVFFTTGNHDYYSGADAWLDRVRALGMRPLRNERVTIGGGCEAFDLAGVDDHHAALFGGDHGEDLPHALEGRDPGRALVLLAHDPTTFKRAAALGVDLQISGHTHGGQIWPFRYLVRIAIPYVAGSYRKNGAQLYVSRGTGFWGPPMRLFAPAEITELVLRRSSDRSDA